MPVPFRPLHVLNYAWPHIDGYTVRSAGMITAQREVLGYDPHVAASPFNPLAKAQDGAFTASGWGPSQQTFAAPRESCDAGPRERAWERPSVGFAPLTGREFARGIAAVAARRGSDLIHAHHPAYAAAAGRAAARRLGLPFVYELRCFNGDYDLDDPRDHYAQARGRWRNRLEYRLARSADAVVTLADAMAARLAANGVPERRIHVVRNSVDTALFPPREPREPRPREPGRLRVGYATTFEEMENLDAAARAAGDAAAILAREGVRLTFEIAGKGRDWERIDTLVREEGLEGTVTLPGFVPYSRMPDFYAGLDLFLVPRKEAAVSMDTTPLKPLEAASRGVPLAVSDLPALRALLGEGTRRFAPTREGIREAILDFARSPWPPASDASDRSWAGEVRRYEAVYADARSNDRVNGGGARLRDGHAASS